MKCLFCYNQNDFRLENVPKPEIDSNEMLIEMIYTGLCGSDIIKISDPASKKPAVYGHEVVGKVVKKGLSVENFEIGDIVVAAHHIPCYSCHYCRHGNYSMCRHFKETNIYPGSFCQYIRLSREHIRNTTFKLPEGQVLTEALFIEPLGCCIRAMDRIKPEEKDFFTIVGTGAIGMLFIQLLKLGNYRSIAIDLDDKRLILAKELGADYIINPSGTNLLEKINDITKIGVDFAMLTVTCEATLNDAVNYIRDGGEINIFGMTAKKTPFPIDFENVYKRELTIKSTYSSTPASLKKAYELITKKKIKIAPLVSEVLPLDQFKEGLNLMLDRKIYKAIFELE